MKNWSEDVIAHIDKTLENVGEKELRFFRVDEFKRNIKRVEEFSGTCDFCQKQKEEIAEVAETILEAVSVPGNYRRSYDRVIARLSGHMRKKHGFYTPFWFSYLYSFYGFVAGLIAGFLLSRLFPAGAETAWFASFAVCIVAAYLAGSRRDVKVRTEKRLM